TTGNGDITLRNDAGTLAIGTATVGTLINAGAGIVRLQSGGGISQTVNGTITADALGILAAGDVDLGAVSSGVATTCAANDSGAGNHIVFRNVGGFTVGQVTASGIFSSNATGVTTINGDITLRNNAGQLTIGTATVGTGINAGGGVVRLQSG